jgi:CheY-like chemotaxis protein
MFMKPAKYKNVMLLDDGELDNFVNEKIIERNGFAANTYIYTKAKQALGFLKDLVRTHDAKSFPKVIFTDLNMPEMDGLEFIQEFKKVADNFLQNCKLVLLTSSLNPKDKEKAMEVDNNIMFISKPLTDEILDAIYKTEPKPLSPVY